jgi:predicted O-methyltransferase YrrM
MSANAHSVHISAHLANNDLMRQAIRSFLGRLEETGKLHDATEPEHAKRFLNLEKETAETVVLLMKIAGVRNIVEIGASNG